MGKQTSTRIMKIRQAYSIQSNVYKALTEASVLIEELNITVPRAAVLYLKVVERLEPVYKLIVKTNNEIFFPDRVVEKK